MATKLVKLVNERRMLKAQDESGRVAAGKTKLVDLEDKNEEQGMRIVDLEKQCESLKIKLSHATKTISELGRTRSSHTTPRNRRRPE